MRLAALIFYGITLCVVCSQDIVPEYENEEENCDNLVDGKHSVRDCFAYLLCTNGTSLLVNCPQGEVFSSIILDCVPGSNVTEKNFCNYRTDGPYRDPWDCRKLIRCISGWTTFESCEDGLIYNATSNVCHNETYSQHCYILGPTDVHVSNHSGNETQGGFTTANPDLVTYHPTTTAAINQTTNQSEITNMNNDETCNGLSNGRHCLRDCFAYMICTNGVKEVVECEENKIYNPALKKCSDDIKEDEYCVYRPDGFYRNPWNCHSYIKCLLGKTSPGYCSEGLSYVPESNTCENSTFVHHCHILDANGSLTTTTTQVPLTTTLPTETTSFTPTTTTLPTETTSSTPTTTAIPITTPATTTMTTTTTTTTAPITTITTTLTTTELPETTTESTMSPVTTTSSSTLTPETTPVVVVNDYISSIDLLSKLSKGDLPLIDVRDNWEIKLEGRIAQSINIPLSKVDEALNLSPEAFHLTYAVEKPQTDDCHLVFYCKSGYRSQKALVLAKNNGYKCAKYLMGGFNAWKALYP